jgi:hypothetical protein
MMAGDRSRLLAISLAVPALLAAPVAQAQSRCDTINAIVASSDAELPFLALQVTADRKIDLTYKGRPDFLTGFDECELYLDDDFELGCEWRVGSEEEGHTRIASLKQELSQCLPMVVFTSRAPRSLPDLGLPAEIAPTGNYAIIVDDEVEIELGEDIYITIDIELSRYTSQYGMIQRVHFDVERDE